MQRFNHTVTSHGFSQDGRDDTGRPRETVGSPLLPSSTRRAAPIAAAGLALAILGWALATLFVEQFHFAILAPRMQAGVEAAAALARLFGALVLGLFFAGRFGERLLWVAGGLLVLGLGNLGFGYLVVLLGGDPDLNTAAYQSLLVWTVAGALFVVGLVPKAPPRFRWRPLAISLVVFGAVGVALYEWANALPLLAPVASPESAVAVGRDLPGTTAWHLALSAVPLGLTVAAALGAAAGYRREAVPGWLLVAMTLFAGTQLHNLFWPSVYSSVLATADVLGLSFAAVVVLGGIFELRSAAAERAALLAEEKERTRRLGELATLKADFTAMVVHELVSPLSAVRRLADVLDFGASDPELRAYVIGGIRKETDDLIALVADVRATATVERDDFEVKLCPVALAGLLEEARAYARVLPGDHPVSVSLGTAGEGTTVRADAGRIGQVLRNLLSNATNHSPDGAPIELRFVGGDGRVRVEVADRGAGVHPDDLGRIFEKFGRGRDADGCGVSGAGLGLYICRRILLSHGSELAVRSTVGEGSVFSFELEVVKKTGREDGAR